MGKTFKDRNKWDRKQKDREGQADNSLRETRKGRKARHHEELLPEGDQLDPYEQYDFEDYE